jgi:hypothetical protein
MPGCLNKNAVKCWPRGEVELFVIQILYWIAVYIFSSSVVHISVPDFIYVPRTMCTMYNLRTIIEIIFDANLKFKNKPHVSQ